VCEVSLHRHSAYLTDIRRNASAGFGLRMEKVPVAYQRVRSREVDDIWESDSAKSSDYECKGCRSLSVIPGDNTEVRRWSTYEQGESRRGEGK
jgi:hypothetical protein